MPNILILVSDEHNPLYSSVYGSTKVKTPNMERLAARGTVFENAYCVSPLCTPSRSSFLIGTPVHLNQCYSNCRLGINPPPSYGELLDKQGIHTANIGNDALVWGNADRLKFSEILPYPDKTTDGACLFRQKPIKPVGDIAEMAYGPREDAFDADIPRIDEGIRWLREESYKYPQGWVAQVNLICPHPPFCAPPDVWEKFEGDMPKYGRDHEMAQHPYARDLQRFFATDTYSDERIRDARRGYYARVDFVDQELGRLMDALEETGHDQDTICIYMSDHGEMLGKFGIWCKSSLIEDSVKVPLIIAGPGFEPGKRVKTPVTLLDLHATIFAATEKARPDICWGEPLQTIPDNDAERVIFAEYHGFGVHSGGFMVRRGDWKLIYCMDAPHLLFNLRDDPDEVHNLAEERPDKFREMETVLREVCSPEVENERAFAFERMQKAMFEAKKTAK